MSPEVERVLRLVWQAAGGFPDAFPTNERSVLALVEALRIVAATVPNQLGALAKVRRCDHSKAVEQLTGDGSSVLFCPDCGRNLAVHTPFAEGG